MATNNQRQTFSIAGKLDISDIVNKSTQLRDKLKSNLNAESFKKIEKEYQRLQQSLISYEQAMSRSFSDQTDIRNAQKALNNFYQTMSKFTTVAQSAVNTKNIKLAPDIANQLKKEAEAIQQEQERINSKMRNWQNSLKNIINATDISRSDKQNLVSSILDKEEFSKQIDRITNEIKSKFEESKRAIEREFDTTAGAAIQAQKVARNSSLARENFLSNQDKKDYAALQSTKNSASSKVKEQEKEAKNLTQNLQNTQESFKREIEELKNLEQRLIEANRAAHAASDALKLYKTEHPGANIKTDETLRQLQKNQVTTSQNARNIRNQIGGRSSEKIEKEREQEEKRLKQLNEDIQKQYAIIRQAEAQINAFNEKAVSSAENKVQELNQQAEKLLEQIQKLEEQNDRQISNLNTAREQQAEPINTTAEQDEINQRTDALNAQVEAERERALATSNLENSIEDLNRTSNEQRKNDEEHISNVQEQIQENNQLNDSFNRLKENVKMFLSISNGFRLLKQVIRSTFEDVKELDKAFASIAMVTDYSVQEMWSSYNDYAEMANRLGQSTKDVIASSALFYQQGNRSHVLYTWQFFLSV